MLLATRVVVLQERARFARQCIVALRVEDRGCALTRQGHVSTQLSGVLGCLFKVRELVQYAGGQEMCKHALCITQEDTANATRQLCCNRHLLETVFGCHTAFNCLQLALFCLPAAYTSNTTKEHSPPDHFSFFCCSLENTTSKPPLSLCDSKVRHQLGTHTSL